MINFIGSVFAQVDAAVEWLRDFTGKRLSAIKAAEKRASAIKAAENSVLTEKQAAVVAATAPASLPPPPPPSTVQISRVFFWTHHMRVKQLLVYKWSAELRVTGRCKIGRPGWLLAEADAMVMEEFVRRVKKEHWRRILLKWQSTDTLPIAPRRSPSKAVDASRFFPDGMREVSTANDFCTELRQVGLHEALEAGTGLEMKI